MRPLTHLTLIIAALALLASWAVLGDGQAAPSPAQANDTYLPLIVQPASPGPPTATATATRTTAPALPTATATVTATTQVSNCHPSYPSVCIRPPPPDLNCGDIPHRRFQVVGSDPHGFDTDGDGIGCESR